MAQATKSATRPDPAAQFRCRGYVLSEDADFHLRDAAMGLHAISQLCDEQSGNMPEIPPAYWAGLLRTFSRTLTQIANDAPFANEAMARKRNTVGAGS